MKLKDLISLTEKYFPLNYAYEWDNPGLLIGDENREVKKILLSLDITEENLDFAIKNGVNTILTHHPVIFSGVKNINTSTKTGRILLKAAENKISVYSAHTNMDVAPDGINTYLAKMFNLQDTQIIEPDSRYENTGLGRIGKIKKTTLSCFLEEVKNILNTPFLRYSGNENQQIQNVAIGSGSCSELIPKSIEMGADTIITADLKYHTCLDFASDTFSIIDAGHFPTENIVKDIFYNIFSDTGIEILKYDQEDIFKFI